MPIFKLQAYAHTNPITIEAKTLEEAKEEAEKFMKARLYDLEEIEIDVLDADYSFEGKDDE